MELLPHCKYGSVYYRLDGELEFVWKHLEVGFEFSYCQLVVFGGDSFDALFEVLVSSCEDRVEDRGRPFA